MKICKVSSKMTSTEDLIGTNSCVDEARTGESVRKKQSVSGTNSSIQRWIGFEKINVMS